MAEPADFGSRPGEVQLATDPAAMKADAGLVFIGTIRSPWLERGDCPKNMAQARESGAAATAEIEEPYRAGLHGLSGFSHLIVLTWLDRAPRDLIRQVPRHLGEPRGTFALRSPARVNPIGLHVVRLVRVDEGQGVLTLDAIDVLDGTPIIDIKPYYASIDAFADALRP